MKNQRGSLQKRISEHGSHPRMTNADHTIYISFFWGEISPKCENKKEKGNILLEYSHFY
jgi:hypothetical protein